MRKIKYKKGYKYQLSKDVEVYIPITPRPGIYAGYISLGPAGNLVISQGYAWDGPSGPTLDTKSFMRGSLVHDALYQLMRDGHLPKSHRKEVDLLLREHCREDGMNSIRAWWVYQGVRLGGASALKPKQILEAP